jgi:hypothetical protein
MLQVVFMSEVVETKVSFKNVERRWKLILILILLPIDPDLRA